MTELEQYKKAYATLVGKIDKNISLLEVESEIFRREGGAEVGMAGGLFIDTLASQLKGALLAAEEIFLAEDPEK